MAELIEAVDGPIALTTCLEEERLRDRGHVPGTGELAAVNDAIREALQRVTLAEMTQGDPEAFLLRGAAAARGAGVRAAGQRLSRSG